VKSLTSFAALAFLLAATGASAQPAAPAPAAAAAPAAQAAPARELTLEQALDMARKANRSLAVERARLAQVQTTVEQAWAALIPTLAAQGKYTRNNVAFIFPVQVPVIDPITGMPQINPATGMVVTMPKPLTIQPVNQLDGAITFAAPLIAPPAYAALGSVKSNVAASEANYAATTDQVLFSVAQTFYAAAGADEVLLARKSNVDVARATLDNSKARFSAGSVTKVDVDRAELSLVRAEQSLIETENAREQTYRSLATLIQAQGPFKVVVPPAPASARHDETLDMALQLRPEFKALQLTMQSADQQAEAYGWRWAPTLSGFGNARIFNYDNFAFEHHAWALGLQLDWILYDGGTRDAQRHLADAQALEAQDREAVLRDTISDDLANGRSQLETKTHAREAAERSVTLASETIDLVRTQYEAGTATQLDLLQAQDNLIGAQEALAQAHFDVAVADLTLRRAAGTFPGK
jgi:outer membrane protein TolC